MFAPLRTHGESMAIDASSDIVLEVAKAADPARAAAVAQRLNALSGAAGARRRRGRFRRHARRDRARRSKRTVRGRRARARFSAAADAAERQGRQGEDRIRGGDAQQLRQRDAAEGRELSLRPGARRRHVEVDARRPGFAADRQDPMRSASPSACSPPIRSPPATRWRRRNAPTPRPPPTPPR